MSIIAAIQMNSNDMIDENLLAAKRLLQIAAKRGARLAVLPENFALMQRDLYLTNKEPFGHGKIQDFLAEQAQKLKIWLIGGTIPIATNDPNKVYAASLIYTDQGQCLAHYDKIHLFDVVIGQESYQESELIQAGSHPILIESPFGKIGMAVCYDLRFPNLFRYYFDRGAEIFVLPTAFTVPTGQAHWEVLTRARAIENFCYFIAACQTGSHPNGRETYGHSLIIDPWGKILVELAEGEGVITADIDLNYLRAMREKIPIQRHSRRI